VKKGWKAEPLGELCDVLDHKRKPITKKDRIAGEYPYYGATGVLGHVEGYLFDEPLVLVGEDGAKWASGEDTAFAVEGKIWVNNHAHVLRPHRSRLLDSWLIYHLNHSDLKEFVSGLTVPKLNQGNLREIPIPVPPLAEQKRIVGLLDEASEGLDAAKANTEKNLRNARALFESHLESVFTQRGPGWEEKTLGEVADLLDCLHKTPTYAETGFPMVRVTDIKPGLLDLSKTRKVDEQTFIAFSKGRRPSAGDIVFSRVGSCGVSALVSSDEPFCLGQNTVFILPKMNSKLLYHFLNSPNAKEQFEGFIDGTTQPTISMKSIRQVVVPIAPPAEHGRLVGSLDSMREETQRLANIYTRKLTAFDALKKSLLHLAFTGAL
jgi:type I restriction enzyme, S subunit